MTIEKNLHGAWVVYDIINGYLVHQQYYGYTKKQAIALFKQKYGYID